MNDMKLAIGSQGTTFPKSEQIGTKAGMTFVQLKNESSKSLGLSKPRGECINRWQRSGQGQMDRVCEPG